MNAIILRKFKLNYLTEDCFIVIIGMINSGKSFITKDILHHFNDIPSGIVISQHGRKQNSYNYIPPIFIYDNIDKKILHNYCKNKNKNKDSEYDNRSFIIFENLFYEVELNKNKYFQRIVKSTKLLNYLCIIEAINLVSIDNKTIENIDYLFILKENFDINRKRIYNQFSDYLQIPYTLFCKFLDDYTDNYNFLVLDLKSNSENLQDKLFWYKSDNHTNFKMCCNEAWNFNNKNYIKEPELKLSNRYNLF